MPFELDCLFLNRRLIRTLITGKIRARRRSDPNLWTLKAPALQTKIVTPPVQTMSVRKKRKRYLHNHLFVSTVYDSYKIMQRICFIVLIFVKKNNKNWRKHSQNDRKKMIYSSWSKAPAKIKLTIVATYRTDIRVTLRCNRQHALCRRCNVNWIYNTFTQKKNNLIPKLQHQNFVVF